MEYLADVGVTILLFVLLGVSLNILVGFTGQISLAHAIFYGLGAYTVGLLTLAPEPLGTEVARGVTSGAGWPFLPALTVGTAVAFFASVLVAIPALRVRGEYLILLTLAFQLVVNQLMETLSSVTGGPYGLTPIPPIDLFGFEIRNPPQVFLLLVVVAMVFVLITWWLGASPFGRLLKGIREDEGAIAALGKNPVVAKVLAFAIAAGMAGFVGGIAAAYFRFIAPGNYSLDISIFLVAVVVLGGSGNVMGVVFGALVLGGLRPILENVIGDQGIVWQSAVYGGALIAFMYLRPRGVFPEGTGIDRLFRERIYLPALRRGAGGQRHTLDDESGALPGGRSELSESSPNPASDMVLEVRGLVKHFNGIKAVNGVDFGLQRGRITGLVGPNGAGKTTVFNLIAGTIRPDAGQVMVRGDSVIGLRPYQLASRGVARSFQDIRVFQQMTVLDNVAIAIPEQPGENFAIFTLRPIHSFRGEARTYEQASEIIRFVGLEGFEKTPVSELSFGDQKLVALARVLATGSDVLLLDEPTSGVDPQKIEHIIKLIRKFKDAGKTICIVEHSVHLISQLADHVVFLDNGRVLAQGTMDQLATQKELVEIYFGT